jgi:NADPH:quinone reductase-like Zn-dependent oxidoreductase
MALDMAKVDSRSHVLVQAGAGGVGSFAIQLAKARGARVVTTCSTRNVDFCKVVAPPR